ncbi:hypothetical protein TALC_00734 [Thermoplasmatales archaeon BRNA1]|nr:hypothetical protein TALC_00734 [Thermoplasmatales archaeon BRNA1]
MSSLDEKYNGILELLRENGTKLDDIVIASGNANASGIQQAPAAPAPAGDTQYMTSREQFESYQKVINRRDGEFAEKQFMHLLEQLCLLREDFLKLCSGMQTKIDTFSASDVLASFRAYGVDIENMLTDAGVKFGTFGNPGSQVDTNNQRIVSVVPTSDPSRNGVVAQRLSSGYQYQGRTIVKEKVTVYRTASAQEKA